MNCPDFKENTFLFALTVRGLGLKRCKCLWLLSYLEKVSHVIPVLHVVEHSKSICI